MRVSSASLHFTAWEGSVGEGGRGRVRREMRRLLGLQNFLLGRGRGTRLEVGEREGLTDLVWKMQPAFLPTSHWPELSRITAPNCKVCWEV